MRRLLLVVLFLMPILAQGVSAQDEDERWFFAEDADNDQIIAYNLDGDIIPVLDLGSNEHTRGGWRIDSRTMLLMVTDGADTDTMAVVSPDGAKPISYTFEYGVSAVAYHYPYVVFMPVEPRRIATPAVLVNIEEATATLLGSDAAPIIEALPCCRFSEDGTSLRYVAKSQLDEDNIDLAQFELRERDLATGEETQITSVDSEGLDEGVQVSSWQPDADGGRWLVLTVQSGEDGLVRTTWMITLDGTATVLDESSTDAEAIPVYRFEDDVMWITDALCSAGCTVDLDDAQGNEIISVTALAEETIQRINYMGDSYIIAESRETVLRLTPDGAPRVIGYRDYTKIEGVNVTPNGRLLTLVDGEEDSKFYFIYDSLTGESIYMRSIEGSIFVFNTLQGHWLRSYITGRIDGELREIYVIADTDTGEMVEVIFERVTVAEILSLDELIIWERNSEADTNRLSIYSPRSESKTLLLEGNYFPIDGPNIGDTLRY